MLTLRDSSRVSRRRPIIYLKPPYAIGSVQSYRVAQLRTNGVHCRESAGTGPVNLKVVPNECCLFNMRLSFPHTHCWNEVDMLKVPAIRIYSNYYLQLAHLSTNEYVPTSIIFSSLGRRVHRRLMMYSSISST